MDLIRSLALAFSCFTCLPAPKVEWEPDNMRFMLAWFPLVGVVIGLLVALWCVIADAVGFGSVLRAAGVALVPLAVTGGFHLDGFADVVDAQSSHAEPAKKRKILKDSHVGAFAVIGIAAYLIAYFAVATELSRAWQVVVLLACLHVMSRCGSAFASTVFWGNGQSGMLNSFSGSADMRMTVGMVSGFFAIAFVVAFIMSPVCALVMAIVEIAMLLWLNWFAQRNFGGMSGDVAGFFLQTCELVLLVCIMIAAKAVGL